MRINSILVITLVMTLAACAPPRQVVTVTGRPVPPQLEEPQTETETQATEAVNPYAGIATGRFDGGKMWTFDHPPLDYFEEEYGFRPDSAWFNKARRAALRFSDNCSASFVSAHGLVMTNHHCARESITKVSREGENLLDNGFYADSLASERKVEELYVDQLLSISDVTDKIYAAGNLANTPTRQAEARDRKADAIQKSLEAAAKAKDSTLVVEVIPLYEGGQYAAYTFKRFKDVRLVVAPELKIGFFGGDWDNFTYPRYNLDMSFFRVYDEDGEPLDTPTYFQWDASGAEEGEAVFVVGNPGSTSRLSTVDQLKYFREVELPLSLSVMRERSDLLDEYIQANPDTADVYDLRNVYFSLQNSIKAEQGQLDGLRSDWLIPRRGAAHAEMEVRIASNDSLNALYGDVFEDLAEIQSIKRTSARKASAFAGFLAPPSSSRILMRAMYGYVYSILKQRGAPPDQLEEIRKEALTITSTPRAVDEAFIAARLRDLQRALGDSDPTIKSLMAGTSIDSLAHSVAIHSALADSAGFRTLLDKNYLASGDVSVALIEALAPLYFTLNQELENFEGREVDLNARLGRARFAVYGTSIPPDASFSLRLADGRVKAYSYNGTRAPAFTTYFGLFGRYYSHDAARDWSLPDRWLTPPSEFDYRTEVNLVSTNDITGGNSGSPLLDQQLRVVGLVFDSNIEALPNEFLYTEGEGRTVSVDVRGMLEALDDIYDADRIVLELSEGAFYETEVEADAAVPVRTTNP